MSTHKVPLPAATHHCPSCQGAQTKIKRVLSEKMFGSKTFVCTRIECPLGIDVSKLGTWVVD